METAESVLCVTQNNRALLLKIDVAVEPGFVLSPSKTVPVHQSYKIHKSFSDTISQTDISKHGCTKPKLSARLDTTVREEISI